MKKTPKIIISIFSVVMVAILCVAILMLMIKQKNFSYNNSSSEPQIESSTASDASESEPVSSQEKTVVSETEENVREIDNNISSKANNNEFSVPITVIKESETTTSITTFEEGTKQLDEIVAKYLAENNIEPKTAGETGEICAHCGKKIWNPDKYGFCIPGYPEDYENSGYCNGACGIVLN